RDRNVTGVQTCALPISVDNRRITIPNGTLTSASIVNVTAQDKRQLDLKVQISYSSDLKKAKGILENMLYGEACILHDDGIQVFEIGRASCREREECSGR